MPNLKNKYGKKTLSNRTLKLKCRPWREKNTFPSSSSLTTRILFIFRQRKTDLIRSNWITKCLFSRRHVSTNHFLGIQELKKHTISLIGKLNRFLKFKQPLLKNKTDSKNKNIHGTSCFFESFFNSLIFVFRNEDKLVAVLVYSSFGQVAISILVSSY